MLPREASKRAPIFDRGTGSKPERLTSGSLQADLSLIVRVILQRACAQAPRFFVIYDSQFPLASSRFGRDSIQYRVGKTHCQGHQDPSKRVSIFLGETEANVKMVSINRVSISRSRTVLVSRTRSARLSSGPFDTQGGKQASSYFRQRKWVQARVAQIRFPAG